jgi:hypothetical protein
MRHRAALSEVQSTLSTSIIGEAALITCGSHGAGRSERLFSCSLKARVCDAFRVVDDAALGPNVEVVESRFCRVLLPLCLGDSYRRCGSSLKLWSARPGGAEAEPCLTDAAPEAAPGLSSV